MYVSLKTFINFVSLNESRDFNTGYMGFNSALFHKEGKCYKINAEEPSTGHASDTEKDHKQTKWRKI